MGGTDLVTSAPVLEVGKAVNLGLGQDGPTFGSDFIMAAWAPGTGIAITDEANFLTARITLTENAIGTWRYFGSVSAGDPGRVFGGGVVINGVMIIPEPSTADLAFGVFSATTFAFFRHVWQPRLRQRT